MKPCVTPVLDDYELGLILDALGAYLEKLDTENKLCARSDRRSVIILKKQLESLLKLEDIQVIER